MKKPTKESIETEKEVRKQKITEKIEKMVIQVEKSAIPKYGKYMVEDSDSENVSYNDDIQIKQNTELNSNIISPTSTPAPNSPVV